MAIRQGIRVAFTGAGGTGKTTSAEFISKELGLPLMKSASRVQYEADGLTEEKVLLMTDKDKFELQLKIFKQKVKQDQDYSYIADRTILDHYAYCLAYLAPFMTNSEFGSWEDEVRTLMRSTYSKIFYLPWGYWLAEDDGVRHDSHAWQSQIDTIIVGYLNRWDISVTIAPQEFGADARNQFIMNQLVGGE